MSRLQKTKFYDCTLSSGVG